MARTRELNRLYLNDYVTSGRGTSLSPWVLDTTRLNAAVASDVLIDADGMGAVYGYSNTAGLVIPANLRGVRVNLRGSTLRNIGSGSAQCVISIGGWDAGGSPVASDTNCNESCVVENAILDGGSNGAAIGLRVLSGHYCRFDHVYPRNTTAAGIKNLGGVFTEFKDCNVGYDPISGGTWTQYHKPASAFTLDAATSATLGTFTPSTIRFIRCESYGALNDGFRLLSGFNTVLESCASEVTGNTDTYAVNEGALTELQKYAAREAWCAANHGAGFYVGAAMMGTTFRGCDPEYSADYPNGGGYKMGFVIDAGARDTTLIGCCGFNANTVVQSGSYRTVIIGGGGNVIANGAHVRVTGGRDLASVTRGPSLTNFYYEGADYTGHAEWDQTPPMNIGGFRVGYDGYNNPGPVESQSLPMLFNKSLATPYPDFAVMQDSSGLTRLNGSELWLTVRDRNSGALSQHVQCTLAAGVNKIGVFGATPVAQQAIGSVATDAATTLTLANNLRTALIALGWCKQ
jgi:hypothetical protein